MRMPRGRRLVIGLGLAVAVAGASFGAVSLVGGGPGYRLTAYFQQAIDLYPGSAVKLMGFDAGTVDSVTPVGDHVRVVMTMDSGVPLPRDVDATIEALTIIGDRNVVLSPPWHPGEAKVPPGFVIPADHTVTPVEVDQALQEIENLANSIEPNVVSGLVDNAANAFAGEGQDFSDALGSASTVAQELGQEDQQVLATARSLDTLSQTVDDNQQALAEVVNDFSQTTAALASERQEISSLLSGANTLVGVGSSLLSDYQGRLPTDIAELSALGETLQANAGTLGDLIDNFPIVAQGLVDAYNPDTHLIELGASLTPTIESTLGVTFDDILARLGIGPGCSPGIPGC